MTFATTADAQVHVMPRKAQRPTGALMEALFKDSCTGCGDCVEVCPAGLVVLDRDRFPRLIPGRPCKGYGLCAEVCTPGAIAFTQVTRMGLASVKASESLRR